ncbi:uncharacterized protein LOC6580496 [Drosophila mojavensis]|uniref:DDE Tnp4 domain-containing protein n=1 Tax=Drosophila mojavensis TaxID=7230 RepID=B4KQC9_DROMO|nr:uncharacterized protein LOC6580496 [Drosophila mojavensis]EDW10269.1 uncharacterized protein Dmoj_GI20986 [Drosophila mojavensis]
MSLTIVKYRKTADGVQPITPTMIFRPKIEVQQQQAVKKIAGGSIALGKIPAGAIIRTSMKRASTSATTPASALVKAPKFVNQSSGYGSSSSPTLSWQTSSPLINIRKESLGAAISSLPPNTIIKATTRQPLATSNSPATAAGAMASAPAAAPAVTSAVRQAVFLKRDMPQRTMRSMTLGSIDMAPTLHLGVSSAHLPLFKRHICKYANLSHLDCCIALRKLRLNEPFALLAEFFELSELEVEQTFKHTIVKLARCLRPLIRWPDAKHYSERLKHMPLAYRANMLHVRSVIECVETDLSEKLNFGCGSYKFILCLNTNGIISYVSDTYRGDCDDLQLFEASNFKDVIPKYLTLCAEPGQAVKRLPKANADDILTDEEYEAQDEQEPKPIFSKYDEQRLAGQLANMQSLSVSNGALTSTRAPQLQLPTLRVNEPACRSQLRQAIDTLREFKMLDHCAVQHAPLLGYLNEMLIVAAALYNLQQQ